MRRYKTKISARCGRTTIANIYLIDITIWPGCDVIKTNNILCSITRLNRFQPHGLFSECVRLVKFWMGRELVGLEGRFFNFYQKNFRKFGVLW